MNAISVLIGSLVLVVAFNLKSMSNNIKEKKIYTKLLEKLKKDYEGR